MHHRTDSERGALFSRGTTRTGQVTKPEPGKCARREWFPIDHIPDSVEPHVADALARNTGRHRHADGWR
jgi:hypothetical protein